MDDRELEARLRTRLHQRFDESPIPPALASNVQRALASTPVRAVSDVRWRGGWLGWSAVAAALVLAAATLVVGTMPGPGGTQTASPASTPVDPSMEPEQGSWRYFAVLPRSGVVDDPDASVAFDVLRARVNALQVANSTLEGGNGIFVGVSPGEPSDGIIRAVLAATGDVEFVPLPAADYGNAGLQAEAGKPLPKSEPALFGWEGIESVALGTDQQSRIVLEFTLKPLARQAFADYTAAHTGEYFAVVVDGVVVVAPVINEPIPGGQVAISSGELQPNPAFSATAAVLIGGVLPESWRGAIVPVLITRDAAVSAALSATNGGTVRQASPAAERAGAGDPWRLVWNVEVFQPACSDLGSCVGDMLVKVDGVTGAVMHIGAVEP
ncbi:MAG: hypothetical protein ABI620_06930 [Chloroflexota bacterium]